MIKFWEKFELNLPVLLIFIIVYALIINNMPINFTFNLESFKSDNPTDETNWVIDYFQVYTDQCTLKNISFIPLLLFILIAEFTYDPSMGSVMNGGGSGKLVNAVVATKSLPSVFERFKLIFTFFKVLTPVILVFIVIRFIFEKYAGTPDFSTNQSQKWYYNLQLDGWPGQTMVNMMFSVGLIFSLVVVIEIIVTWSDNITPGILMFISFLIFIGIICLYLKLDGTIVFLTKYKNDLYESVINVRKRSKLHILILVVFLCAYYILNWRAPLKNPIFPIGLFYSYSIFVKLLQFMILIRSTYYMGSYICVFFLFSIFHMIHELMIRKPKIAAHMEKWAKTVVDNTKDPNLAGNTNYSKPSVALKGGGNVGTISVKELIEQ